MKLKLIQKGREHDQRVKGRAVRELEMILHGVNESLQVVYASGVRRWTSGGCRCIDNNEMVLSIFAELFCRILLRSDLIRRASVSSIHQLLQARLPSET